MASIPGNFVGDSDPLQVPDQALASALLLHLAWLLFVPAVYTIAQRGGRFTGSRAGWRCWVC